MNQSSFNVNPLVKLFVLCMLIVMVSSCARSVTPTEAASGRYKRCRSVS